MELVSSFSVLLMRFDAISLVPHKDPPPPLGSDVLLQMLFSPVNPADLLEIDGSYANSRLPLTPGAEGVGQVVACGPEVKSLAVGDLVVPLPRGNWQTYRTLDESALIPLPKGVNLTEAAMLRVNPATAHLLLADRSPGDWVAYNAPNSSVGRLLAALGKSAKLNMVAVARDPQAAAALAQVGVAACTTGPTLPDELRQLSAGQGVDLALDCVAGPDSAWLTRSLRVGGTLRVYGHLSGKDCAIPSRQLTFGKVQVHGFNLGQALSQLSFNAVRKLYGELAEQLVQRKLPMPDCTIYPLTSIEAALSAARTSNKSKVLIALS
ncbi:zinc-dependent alcohol dehydrogenase family protein [Achromobacter sp. SIMBA_011]|uniref:zinc-dependent alcohol dehydrogenase family protein n=1 Tax=Achromobacter TaxID=222 RepID=UPI0005582092|nr:zinc-dependent alcohol dehydrogenase family protein [Achromobacter xylosoxidans]